MNRFFSVVVTFIFTFGLVFAGPKLEIEGGNTYDWGNTKPEQSPLKASIKLWNKGDEVLHIKNVKPGCGCTTAPLDTNMIAPGKYATLQVSLNTGSTNGPLTKSISIFTNEAENDHKLLFIKANVVRPLAVFPTYIAFNKAIIGEESKASVLVTNNTKEDIVFKKITITNPLIKTNVNEGLTIKPNEESKLEFSIVPDKAGRLDFNVNIETTNKDTPVLELRGMGNVIENKKQ